MHCVGLPLASTPVVYTQVRWWGDAGHGTSTQCSPSLTPEVLVFPLCCGPKYLVRYLRDMGYLGLILWDMASREQVGQCVVSVQSIIHCACVASG